MTATRRRPSAGVPRDEPLLPLLPPGLDLEWVDDAACREVGDTPFLDCTTVQQMEAAKAVCWGGCPVREQCLAFAMACEAGTVYRWGVWGGLTPNERRKRAADAKQRRPAA